MTETALLLRVRTLLDAAVPFPWDNLLAIKGAPRSMRTEQATLELAHLAPELAKMLLDFPAEEREELEHRIAELEADLEDAEAEATDEKTIAENERLAAENDRLRAEVARLTAALNGTLVDGEPR